MTNHLVQTGSANGPEDLTNEHGPVGAEISDQSGPQCPWCRDPLRPWLEVPRDWRRPDRPDSYLLYWCERCNFGSVHPRPQPSELPGFYAIDSYYTHSVRKGAVAAGHEPFLNRVRCHLAWRFDRGRPVSGDLIQELLKGRHSRICELGCGSGGVLEETKKLGHDVVGVEPDTTARHVTQSRGITVYEGTAEELPPQVEPASFDLVLMNHVLEHCLDPVKALQSARSLLTPSGILVCETPNCAAYGLDHAGITWLWLDVPRHLSFFTERSLTSACAHLGFKIVETQVTGYYRQFTTSWIEGERGIWQVFKDCGCAGAALPRQSSVARRWLMLCRTALASRSRKYDSVRVVARMTL